MHRIVVTDALAAKLKRFPERVDLCDENGDFIGAIERLVEAADGTESLASEILQVLREVFLTT